MAFAPGYPIKPDTGSPCNTYHRIVVTGAESGARLDTALAKCFAGERSRSYFTKLIDSGGVLLNGKAAKKRALLAAGDQLEIHFSSEEQSEMTPEEIPLEIIYEDNDLLVVNKRAGMVVHPATGHWSGTFANALLHHCKSLSHECDHEIINLRPGIVHRLDKDTSGLLLGAKHRRAQELLISLFAERKVYKEYLAICCGTVTDKIIDAPLARHPYHRKKMAVAAGGKSALSYCRKLCTNNKLTLASIIIATGRTHQIRVHLKYNNTPVLGDQLYGNLQLNEKYGAKRQMLHAHRLHFDHPITGVPLRFSCRLPEDMKQLTERSGFKIDE